MQNLTKGSSQTKNCRAFSDIPARRLLVATIICAGLLGTRILSALENGRTPPSMMTSLEILVAKNEIQQVLASYSLDLDGDGIQIGDPKLWANHQFTVDGVYEVYLPDGSLSVRLVGREAIAAAFSNTGSSSPNLARSGEPNNVGKHYVVGTIFDELTPTMARTKTRGLIMQATRNLSPSTCTYCASDPMKAFLVVYHDTWRKTSEGWKKILSSVYRNT